MKTHTISVEECSRRLAAGETLNLLDVRTPTEYASVHAKGARLAPLYSLKPSDAGPARPLLVICQSGSRAANACKKLALAGVKDVFSVEGGTTAWERAGLPVERSVAPPPMSLERQVRIGAGALILLGVAVGWSVHPVGYGLAAFIGGGLLFAGLTNTCGLAWLLEKMPWNR